MLVAGRRLKLATAMVGAAALLAGCGMHPGAAAVVGSESISHERVDDLATALCSAEKASAKANNMPTTRVPSRSVREASVGILVETELAQQFGESKGVEANQQQVSQALAQSEAGLAMLPEDQREDFSTALREYTEAQLMLVEAGRQSLGSNATEDEAMQEGARLLAQYSQDLEVEVDPRYGRFEEGVFKRGGTSLSVAASERARAGDEDQLGEGFVATLPASQQCS